jgi:hypothetical protein
MVGSESAISANGGDGRGPDDEDQRMLSNIRKARLVLSVALTFASLSCEARIVVLTIDLPLDQVANGQRAKVGDQNKARVFYDDATVDPRTHIVRVLQMQQLDGERWNPETLDPVAMPMIDAWLDLKAKPYRYHYRAALTLHGVPVIVEFDEKSRRFSILQQKNLSVVMSAPYRIGSETSLDSDAASVLRPPPAYVVLNMYVTLDQVAAGEASQIGDVDRMRVVYDASAIDPITKRVKIVNLQHFIGGAFNPPHPDALVMPTNDAWLDLNAAPYRLHYRAEVTHGKPILIEIDENTRRLSIGSQLQPGQVLISGTYGFDPTPVTGAEAIAAATRAPDAEVPQ